MRTIWKYPLEVATDQTQLFPRNAQILTVQAQDGTPCLWAIVESERPADTPRQFALVIAQGLAISGRLPHRTTHQTSMDDADDRAYDAREIWDSADALLREYEKRIK